MSRIDAKDEAGRTYTYLTESEPLGEGSFATVWLAEKLPGEGDALPDGREGSMQHVAIKLASDGINPKSLLIREAKILRRLMKAEIPGPRRVVRIGAGGDVLSYDGVTGTRVLIELEYLDGKTLEKWLENDWRDQTGDDLLKTVHLAARYTRQLAEALEELRLASEQLGLSFVHRDLNPKNVMVTSGGLRLFDFNVATDAADQTIAHSVGTRGYIAPEVMLETAQYDLRADLYSLGVIFWQLLHAENPRRFVENHPHVMWPSQKYLGLDELALAPLNRIVVGLLCDADKRIKSPALLIEMLEELEARVDSLIRPPVTREEVLKRFDLIELICELRPSGQASVVADIDEVGALQQYIREHTRVDAPLEHYLAEQIRRALDGDAEAPRLLMLSGNAGDGKSYLIDRLIRHHLAKTPGLRDRVAYIADATHAMAPDESQQERLEAFFAPFAPGATLEKDVYIIAMNTGMVIRFFDEAIRRFSEGEVGVSDLSSLYHTLQCQLGLRSSNASEFEHRVEVVNLDLRSLLSAPGEGEASFFERMLQKLSPTTEDGFLAAKVREYERSRAHDLCSVRFNLYALQRPDVQRALLKLLRRAELDPDVHLSPRNLWGFLYRIITGGLERYDVEERDDEDSLGEVIAKKYDDPAQRAWLLTGHFYELIFNQAELGGVWRALSQHDPAFAVLPAIDRLQTRLSVHKKLDISQKYIEQELGGSGAQLEGLPLDKLLANLEGYSARERENSAVRRQVFFNQALFDKYYNFGAPAAFETLLDAYNAYSRDPKRIEEQHESALTGLCELVREAIIQSYGRKIAGQNMLRVSQPNARSTSLLLVRAHASKLDEYFEPFNLIKRDVHIQTLLNEGRTRLLQYLGYRPKIITLNVAGHRLMVDQALHAFLVQVKRGQQPSAHDLAQFQALRFIAERLGNELARDARELYVLDSTDGTLSKLSRSNFGTYKMQIESVTR